MWGRGERLEALEPRDDLVLVLVSPDISISTGQAYQWFDQAEKIKSPMSISRQDLKVRFRQLPPASWGFFNSFQAVVESRYPQIKTILEELRDWGAEFAALSGSGSSVFGVFSDSGRAQSACNRVRRRLREVVRRASTEAEQSGRDYVLIGRRAGLSAPFGGLVEDFKSALRRLEQGRGKATESELRR